MSRTLIIAFEPSELEQLAGFAVCLAQPFDALLVSGEPSADSGAERVFCARLAEVPTADSVDIGLAAACAGYSHVAFVSSMRGKDHAARVAGRLDAAMVTDVIGVESTTVFRRPVVAGSAIATVEVLSLPLVITIRPAGFPAPQRSGNSSSVESMVLEVEPKSRRIEASAKGGGRPDLTQAKAIVSGGRPLKDAETFERLIGGLADQLGGAVGATRAAVDSGIAPNELQVGQTGKIVAPDLYIAAGISGSTQHMAGIKDSKVIVAINKDPDAPIFEVADFGLVADLYDVIPELRSKL
ncbi:MAG TPA: FAD-binding protein [Fimbriimonas sp.]